MPDELPQLTITPYGPEPDRQAGRPASSLLLGAGWLAAATLAVAASFTKVYTISFADSGVESPESWHYSMDGWGRSRTAPDVFHGISTGGLGSGPRYGVLLCLAAAVMMLGWVVQNRRGTSWGPVINGTAAVFLCGVVACQVLVSQTIYTGPDDIFRFGPSLYLSAGSALLGLLTLIVDRHGRLFVRQPAAADA